MKTLLYIAFLEDRFKAWWQSFFDLIQLSVFKEILWM